MASALLVDASSFSLLYYLIYITHLFIISFEETGGVKTPTGYIFNNKKREFLITTKAQETKKKRQKIERDYKRLSIHSCIMSK